MCVDKNEKKNNATSRFIFIYEDLLTAHHFVLSRFDK